MIILYAILAFVSLVIVCGLGLHLVGLYLPAGHVVGRVLRLQQPVEVVWGVITDFAATPSWHGHVKQAERLPDQNGHEVWAEYHKGVGKPLQLETTESVAPRRLVRTIDDGQQFFRGRWEFDLVPQGNACTVTLTEHGEILKPMVRSMARLFFNPAMYLENYLKALARKFREEPNLDVVEHSPTNSVRT